MRVAMPLLYALVSAVLALLRDAWQRTAPEESGLYLEVLFLDTVLVCGHGVVLLASLGTEAAVARPALRQLSGFARWLRQRLYGVENMGLVPVPSAVPVCLRSVAVQRAIFDGLAQLLRTRTHHMRQYTEVLCGDEFVTFLVQQEVVKDRAEATDVGRALVAQRALYHVTEEHHFHDKPYFYRVRPEALDACFNSDRWEEGTAIAAHERSPHRARSSSSSGNDHGNGSGSSRGAGDEATARGTGAEEA
jgi:hypothetical protein